MNQPPPLPLPDAVSPPFHGRYMGIGYNEWVMHCNISLFTLTNKVEGRPANSLGFIVCGIVLNFVVNKNHETIKGLFPLEMLMQSKENKCAQMQNDVRKKQNLFFHAPEDIHLFSLHFHKLHLYCEQAFNDCYYPDWNWLLLQSKGTHTSQEIKWIWGAYSK